MPRDLEHRDGRGQRVFGQLSAKLSGSFRTSVLIEEKSQHRRDEEACDHQDEVLRRVPLNGPVRESQADEIEGSRSWKLAYGQACVQRQHGRVSQRRAVDDWTVRRRAGQAAADGAARSTGAGGATSAAAAAAAVAASCEQSSRRVQSEHE